jgi:peptidyl-prolyl cis-trans isomerase D
MFDLFRSREKAVRYLLGAILTVVAVSMVTYLIPGFGSNTGLPTNPVLAEIGGKQITASQVQQQFQQMTQGKVPPDLLETYFPDVVKNIVDQQAAVYAAEQMGITASDDEVLASLMMQFPTYFKDGTLQQDQFQAVLTQQGLTAQQVLDELRNQILLRKLEESVLEGVVVTPKEVQQAFDEKYERAKVQYIAFPPAKFRDQAKIADEQVQKWYDVHKAGYMKPEKLSYQVVVLDQAKVEASLVVTDDQLRAAYNASLDNFRMPERAHARHILIKTEGKSDSEKKALKAKADDLLKQLKNGADFADLAKKNSADAAENGGDLGWFVRNQMVPEFDQAAFALKPKDLSGIVTSQYGYHIIQLLEKEPAHLKPFEEVKAELATEVKAQSLTDKMQMLGDQIRDALVKAPNSAPEVAKQYGADLISPPPASAGTAIPMLGVTPEIDQALATMKAGEVTSVLPLTGNRLAVVVLNSRTPGRPAELSEVQAQIRDSLANDAAAALAEKSAKEAAERLKKGEDIDRLAKSYGLEVVTSSNFGRADSIDGIGPASYMYDAFLKPVGTILGPMNVAERQVVAKVIEKTPADETALPIEREALIKDLKQKKTGQRNGFLMDSIMAKLTEEGKVKLYPVEIQRARAAYHQK